MQSPKSDRDEVDLCLHCYVSPVNKPGTWPSALQSQAGSVPAHLEELHRDLVIPGQSLLLTLKHSEGDLCPAI